MKRHAKVLLGFALWAVILLGCTCEAQAAIGQLELLIAGTDIVLQPDCTVYGDTGTAKLTYDEAGNPVLTLDNFTKDSESICIAYDNSKPLNIVLKNKNSISSNDIYTIITRGSLIISGDGELTVKNTDTTGGMASIRVDNHMSINSGTLEVIMPDTTIVRFTNAVCILGKLTVNGGSLTAIGVQNGAYESDGISALDGVTVNGGKLIALAGDAPINSYGIYISDGGVKVAADATLIATGGTVSDEEDGTSCGISIIEGGIEVAGTLTATGGDAIGSNGSSYGICGSSPEDVVTVNGGILTAVAGYGNDRSSGIYTAAKILVNSGTLTARGYNAGKCSYGIRSGDIEMHGGTLTAVSADAYAESIGIEGGNLTVDIQGGIVMASGETSAVHAFRKIKNSIPGTGWNDATGTGSGAAIPVSASGRTVNYKKIMFPANTAVTEITLEPASASLTVDGSIAFTAAVFPDIASDQTVMWRVTGDAVNLYSDAACTQPVGTDATDALTVYAKGISLGAATVTVTSSDGGKTASCAVTVDKGNAVAASVAAFSRFYAGAALPLVVIYGDPVGGEMRYALGTDTATAPADNLYTASVPTAADAGTYYVWYKAVGDANHNDSAAVQVTVFILKAPAFAAAPTAKELAWTGTAQALVNAGNPNGGTIQYALGADGTTAPADGWSESIPTGTDAGTYYVWYKVVGDANHSDAAAYCVTAAIDIIPFGPAAFILPASIGTVEESAFEGLPMTAVEIPNGCESIGKWAFKDCASLTQIRIPASVTVIDETAFDGCGNMLVYGAPGSAAETFCGAHGNCAFVAEQ